MELLDRIRKYREVLERIAERQPHSLRIAERNQLREELRQSRPSEFVRLENRYLPAIPGQCRGPCVWRGAPTETLLRCPFLCPSCLEDARRAIDHIGAIVRGDEPGDFLTPEVLAARLQANSVVLDAKERRRERSYESTSEHLGRFRIRRSASRGRATDSGDPDGTARPLPPSVRDDQARHGSDFTWVEWFGQSFSFNKGNQAAVVRVLWREWEAGGRVNGRGLSEDAIGEQIGSASGSFSVSDTLRGNKALGTMIRRADRGVYALFRPPDSE